ncbi:MAG: DUF1232 domain-containing protein [Anaerolineaceae bacterium]|nr:DUF1232 domain-containing protein [Anaerolineaceae bacterium]
MSEQDLQFDHQLDFYQQMRDNIRKWVEGKGVNYKFADYLLTAPDLFHLLCKLAIDKDVPVNEKAKLAGAIVYFISPIDLIPEAVSGPIGYIDDVVMAALVLNGVINKTNPEIVRRHWAGDKDILGLIQQILQVADEMVGTGLWEKIRKGFGIEV